MERELTIQGCIQQFGAQLAANGRKLDEIQEQIEKIKKRRAQTVGSCPGSREKK